MIKGAHIYLHQPVQNKPKSSSNQNYSQLLNTVLDKLFDYLHLITDTDSTPFIDVKIRLIMDALHICFTEKIDHAKRGYCYGWEIYEFIRNRQDIFRDFHLYEDELAVFLRFIGQVSALDIEEKESVMKAQIKYIFLLV